MKIFLPLFIIIIFGFIGYAYKSKLNNEYQFLKYINSFYEYYVANLALFKNNIVEIIDKYIIMQNNKNAKYNKIFIKNNNLYNFDKEFLQNNISNKLVSDYLFSYLKNIGTNEYEYEKEKNNEFKIYLNSKIYECDTKIKTDGNLYFKLLLSIGAVVAILLW